MPQRGLQIFVLSPSHLMPDRYSPVHSGERCQVISIPLICIITFPKPWWMFLPNKNLQYQRNCSIDNLPVVFLNPPQITRVTQATFSFSASVSWIVKSSRYKTYDNGLPLRDVSQLFQRQLMLYTFWSMENVDDTEPGYEVQTLICPIGVKYKGHWCLISIKILKEFVTVPFLIA